MILQSSILASDDGALLSASVVALVCGVFGALIGSFLNVVIHRVPRDESIVLPNSRCSSCGTSVKPYDNIPVISYLLLGGKCRACKEHFSARYVAVELLTAALFAFVGYHTGLTLALPFDLLFVAALVALIFIDAEHMILPNKITYPGFALALIVRLIVPNLYGVSSLLVGVHGQVTLFQVHALSFVNALFGAALGGGSLWLLGWLWKRLRGVDAMGLGDVKMMLMVGAYLGVPLTILTIFIGFLTGSIGGILMLAKRGERDMSAQLPFGIFLGIGSIGSLLFGTQIINWYLGQF